MAKVRIKLGDNEIEVEGTEEFIKKYTEIFWGKLSSPANPTPNATEKIYHDLSAKHHRHLTPAEFFKSFQKKDGTSTLLIAAKYLEEFRSIQEFSKKDITQFTKDAKLSKDVHSQYYTTAVKQGYLRASGSGKYCLTLTAEEALASMKSAKKSE